jgi:hypothetical protein
MNRGQASMRTVELRAFETEWQAEAVAAVIRSHGIDVAVAGGLTSGFRTETPGKARVMVDTKDLDQAKQILHDHLSASAKLNWDDVDVGTAEESQTSPSHVVQRSAQLTLRREADAAPLPYAQSDSTLANPGQSATSRGYHSSRQMLFGNRGRNTLLFRLLALFLASLLLIPFLGIFALAIAGLLAVPLCVVAAIGLFSLARNA